MRLLRRTTARPWVVRVLQVDLCAAGVKLRATKSDERRSTVSSFAGRFDTARAAINGDFFSYETYGTSGLSVGAGEAWGDTEDTTGSGWVAFGDDRSRISRPREVRQAEGWMQQVVSGHPQIVSEGVALAENPSGSLCPNRHPRTAAGLSRDGRTLILAVVDGRSDRSVGMTCVELGALMREMGAWEALNLDGGGSSAMWVSGAGVVNAPSDGSQRVVANHLAVLLDGEAEPGSCDRRWEQSALNLDLRGASTSTDLDGDGVADVCGRGPEGVLCALAGAQGYGPAFAGPALSDASGWGDAANWGTLQMGDVTGDGRADLCGRGNAGVRCWPSTGEGFGESFAGPTLSDESGWGKPEYYGTIRLADVTGDGQDDLCARAAAGWRCWPSTGAGFGAQQPGPDWGETAGWGAPQYFSTLRAQAPACGAVERCNGRDDTCDGLIDEGCAPDEPDAGQDTGQDPGPEPDAAPEQDAPEQDAPEDPRAEPDAAPDLPAEEDPKPDDAGNHNADDNADLGGDPSDTTDAEAPNGSFSEVPAGGLGDGGGCGCEVSPAPAPSPAWSWLLLLAALLLRRLPPRLKAL
jgi:MYXO-CTERM domain-containing protein